MEKTFTFFRLRNPKAPTPSEHEFLRIWTVPVWSTARRRVNKLIVKKNCKDTKLRAKKQ
jgi:hypothetical protein